MLPLRRFRTGQWHDLSKVRWFGSVAQEDLVLIMSVRDLNGCFILLATISLLALPSKADVWTRVDEKIAKEQNSSMGSKSDIATRLVAERNAIQARSWKNINEHNKQLRVWNSRKTRIEIVVEVLNKIKKCIGGVVITWSGIVIVGGFFFRFLIRVFAHKKDDEMKEEE